MEIDNLTQKTEEKNAILRVTAGIIAFVALAFRGAHFLEMLAMGIIDAFIETASGLLLIFGLGDSIKSLVIPIAMVFCILYIFIFYKKGQNLFMRVSALICLAWGLFWITIRVVIIVQISRQGSIFHSPFTYLILYDILIITIFVLLFLKYSNLIKRSIKIYTVIALVLSALVVFMVNLHIHSFDISPGIARLLIEETIRETIFLIPFLLLEFIKPTVPEAIKTNE